MKKAMLMLLYVTLILGVIHCGGPQKLTQEEYDQLSPQERVTYLEKYLKDHPKDLELKKDLYREYLNMDMPQRAIPVMEDIISQDQYQAEVQFEYGKLMMQRGENMAAYQAFRDALQSPGGSGYSAPISRYLGGKYLIQQVTESEADEAFPTFSPDGNKIVYQSNANGNWDIVERDLSSGDTTVLLNSAADEELPAYSPDGTSLVYTSNVDDRRPIDNQFKVREIYLKNLVTGYVKNLTETVADDWLPRFSHDGSQMLFVTERSDLRSVPYTEKQSDIYKMESNGAFHIRLTDNEYNDGGACFSAADDRIFFHSNRNGSYDIFVMNTDGGTPMTILGDPDANEVNPFVSPDSQYIVYFSDRDGNYDIYRARVDGSDIERLTFNPARDSDPAYSPDGNSIAFHSSRNGNYDIFLLSLEMASEPTVDELLSRLDEILGQ